jgi:hypothetical protein
MKKIAFTIVLNGMPFIKDQYNIIPECFDHWYIIEGAVLPTLDTNWCQNINNEFFSDKKLSIDGTTEFLNSVINDKITVIRKNDFWLGKLEMCNSFMNDIKDCILMQIDVDEIWDVGKLKDILFFAENNEGFDGMMFKCNYYVGQDLIIENENGYSDMWYEWCRLWKIKNQTTWISHEPPRVKGCVNLLSKQFTNNKNWIFDHYAYVNENQLKFKENFYGYTNALNNWKSLQKQTNFPLLLRQFLPWVNDNALVNKIK